MQIQQNLSNYRRVSFFGRPSAGKSTTASYVFSLLKENGYHAELVQEWVKKLAHQKVELDYWHQLLIFSEQLMSERFLHAKDQDIITVTDSPVCLGWMYARHYDIEFWPQLLEIWRIYQKRSPKELMIRLDPGDRFYNEKGRWQTYEQALELDRKFLSWMEEEGIQFTTFNTKDKDQIAQFVMENVGAPHLKV